MVGRLTRWLGHDWSGVIALAERAGKILADEIHLPAAYEDVSAGAPAEKIDCLLRITLCVSRVVEHEIE